MLWHLFVCFKIIIIFKFIIPDFKWIQRVVFMSSLQNYRHFVIAFLHSTVKMSEYTKHFYA